MLIDQREEVMEEQKVVFSLDNIPVARDICRLEARRVEDYKRIVVRRENHNLLIDLISHPGVSRVLKVQPYRYALLDPFTI
jgi:hypothetical protein